jgi:hypothetical protein
MDGLTRLTVGAREEPGILKPFSLLTAIDGRAQRREFKLSSTAWISYIPNGVFQVHDVQGLTLVY